MYPRMVSLLIFRDVIWTNHLDYLQINNPTIKCTVTQDED